MRTKTITRAILGAGALSLLAAAPATAAPPSGPSGSIQLMSSTPEATLSTSSEGTTASGPFFGGVAEFHTTVSGKVSRKASVYVTVVCMQGGDVVYQYSKHSDTDDYSFPLEDQAGQGLEWDGDDATCEAWLIHRVDKGKSSDITVLGTETFSVTGTEPTVDV